jgi:glycerol-3-phosphate acyltransferase PlsX
VGDRAAVAPLLKANGAEESDRLSLVHASQALEMAENPVAGIRAKPDNSISRMLLEVHEGRASAAFSAGNTGGMVAGATLHLARLKGVKRPGIAVPMPTQNGGICLVIDVGANIYCRPIHLVHYAHMAAAYASAVLGIESPRVGILNIGEEEDKGTSLVKETAALLRAGNLNFVGNIEGHAIFKGGVDVVVCEGFVGNIVLKTTEGLAESIMTILGGAVRKAAESEPASASALKAVVGGLKSRMDYAAYGGAPLLGFEGVVLIGHGRSSAEAVASAVRTASEFAHRRVNERIRDAVKTARSHSPEGETAPEGR